MKGWQSPLQLERQAGIAWTHRHHSITTASPQHHERERRARHTACPSLIGSRQPHWGVLAQNCRAPRQALGAMLLCSPYRTRRQRNKLNDRVSDLSQWPNLSTAPSLPLWSSGPNKSCNFKTSFQKSTLLSPSRAFRNALNFTSASHCLRSLSHVTPTVAAPSLSCV